MFQIEASNFYWLIDSADNPEDLCLHGHVVAKIGKEVFEDDVTVSATALYLLKTITEDHIIDIDNQMLPCCGHTLISNEKLDNVTIIGCPNGIDWSVEHEDGAIKITTKAGNETFEDMDEYKKEVFAFADKVKAYYNQCSPKKILTDEYERNGYAAFWNEWHRRRL